MTLYELANDILSIQKALDDAEMSEMANDAIRQYLESEERTLGEKLNAYCALIRNLEAMAEKRAEEAKRLQQLAKSDESKVRRLKDRLLWFLKDVARTHQVDTDWFRITVAANGGKPAVIAPDDPAQWPAEYTRERVVLELDREAIREALERGEAVEGCTLAERNYHLRIR